MPTPNQPARPIHVRVAETDGELTALANEWERLQAQATVTSVFETFDWQHLWWQSYGRGQPLRLFLAWDGESLVGILPLYVHTFPMLRYPVRQLRFVGTGGDTAPDDLSPILAPGRERDVARALAAAVVASPGWDVLLLEDMDPASAFTPAIEEAARRAGLDTNVGRSERIEYITLPKSFDAWLQTLHRDRRYRVRNIRKKLHAAHKARFFVWDDPATLRQGIERLIQLHHKRWENAGQGHAFSSPAYIEFHSALMTACLGKDRLRLYCLELDGQVGAMFYFYKFRGRVYLMQSGFDPELSAVKPGQVLLGHIIEHAIEQGYEVLDFLRGDHRYKSELASGARETVFVRASRPSPGGWVYRARRQVLPKLKADVLRAVDALRPEGRKQDAAAARAKSEAP
jgi:CelD/BcsL family acetyltransferase involved in cellulose biosynthesis